MKKLYRSEKEIIAGVFGGLAELVDVDPTIIRLIAVFVGIGTGILPLVLFYFIAWVLIPKRNF